MTTTMTRTGWIHAAIAACAGALLACGASPAVADAGSGAGGGAAGGGAGGGVAAGGGSGGGGVAGAGGGGTAGAGGGGTAGAGGGMATGGGAGGGAVVAMYPAWQLTDIQPVSPRFNQTYGLSAFAGRPLVAMLLEGF